MGVQNTGDGTVTAVVDEETGPAGVVAGLVSKARVAMERVSGYDQDRANEVVQAVAWAIIERGRAEELARVAVEDTGLGNVGEEGR